GVVRLLVAKPGDTLPVGGLLAVLADPSVSDDEVNAFVAAELGETPAAAEAPAAPAVTPPPAAAPAAAPVAAAPQPTPVAPAPAAAPSTAPASLSAEELAELAARNAQVKASPVALRLANRHGIDLTALQGSGRNGRVSVEDLVNQAGLVLAPSEERLPTPDSQTLIQSNATVKA